MPTGPGVDDEIRALYHGPLGEFTAARQLLAKRLKKAGDARASEVGALRKPSLSAWAVDQLFAREGGATKALVEAGERARSERQRVEAGGDPTRLREALATIRGEVERLAARGVELLAAAERAPGEAVVERVRTNLEALALDPESAAVGARAWLDDDLEPPGFAVMAALQVAAAGGPRAAGAPRTATAPAPHAPAKASAAKAARDGEHRSGPQAVPSLRGGKQAPRAARDEAASRERERLAKIGILGATLATTERDAADRRRAAERAAAEAERSSQDAAEAERRAAVARARAEEAQARSREAKAAAATAEAAAARARQALARAEGAGS